jgi:hypothetical protein
MKNLRIKLASSLAVAAFGATSVHAQTSPLLPGGIVVSIYGESPTVSSNVIPGSNPSNGTTATPYVDGAVTPISLVEYTPTISAGIDNSATPLVAETLPYTGTNGNVGIVGEYGSSSEGTLQLSGDGNYLTIGGYDGNLDENGAGANGYPSPALGQSTDTNVPRVAGIINIATGAVDTSTVLNDIYNTNNPRSVFSSNGTSIYISGQGASSSDQGGLYLTSVGTNTTSGGAAPTPIYNASSTRTVSQFNLDAANGASSSTANTYFSVDQDGKGVDNAGIFEYTGSPTSSQGSSTGTRITTASAVVNGVTLNLSPEGYFFANATTLYVADTGAPKAGGTGDGGIQKWSYVGAGLPWKLDYTLTYNFAKNPGGDETGFESLAGTVVNGTVDLYATSYTSADDAPDGLYGLADPLANTSGPANGEAVVELAASANDSDFKGVAILPQAVPEPASVWVLAGLGMVIVACAARRRTES